SLTAVELKQASQSILPLAQQACYAPGFSYSRFNADGFLLHDMEGAARCYAQLYRNGSCESAMSEATFQYKTGEQLVLREYDCDDALIRALAGYLPFAKSLGFDPPFWMFGALV